MMSSLFLMLQAAGGLSSLPPREEELRFIFPAAKLATERNATISGTGPAPTTHSGPAFYRLVKQCGGKRLGLQGNTARVVVVSASSTDANLAIARCVKESTATRFSVGVKARGFSGLPMLDQQPFAGLWDSKMASNERPR